jgi:hypothetical protein
MNARTKGRGSEFIYERIDERFLSSFFKAPTRKLTPAGANTAAKLKYLADMVHAVIKYDKERKHYTSASLAIASGIMLCISPDVCGFSRELIAEEAKQSRKMMERQVDPTLVEYETKYIGKRFEDEGNVYEVVRISLLVKKRKQEAANELWEVTCVQLVDGKIPISSFVDGTSELLDNKLAGYGVSDTLGTRYAPIDGMITKFEKEKTQKAPVQHRRR